MSTEIEAGRGRVVQQNPPLILCQHELLKGYFRIIADVTKYEWQ